MSDRRDLTTVWRRRLFVLMVTSLSVMLILLMFVGPLTDATDAEPGPGRWLTVVTPIVEAVVYVAGLAWLILLVVGWRRRKG